MIDMDTTFFNVGKRMGLREENRKSRKEKMFMGMIGAALLSLLLTFLDNELDYVAGSLVALSFFVLALYFKFKND